MGMIILGIRIHRDNLEDLLQYLEPFIDTLRGTKSPKVVPPAGIEPAPQSGANFKSAASTNSAKGDDQSLKTLGLPVPEHMSDTLRNIKMPFGWGLEINCFRRVAGALGLPNEYQVRITCGPTVDNMTGEHMDGWNGRWWRLSAHMTNGEIVQTVFKAVMTALEHEAREMFLYKGVSVLDPHYDIDKLAELRKSGDVIKGREPV